MTETAEISRPHTFTEEEYRATLLANLRVARARARLVIHEIDEIGYFLKEGHISSREAFRLCLNARIDSLFPRESDGA